MACCSSCRQNKSSCAGKKRNPFISVGYGVYGFGQATPEATTVAAPVSSLFSFDRENFIKYGLIALIVWYIL